MRAAALGVVVPEHAIRFLGHDEHVHDAPHLVYVAAGRALATVDGERIPLGPQEALWLAPHVPHAVRVLDGGMVLGPLLEPHAVPPGRVRALGVLPALVEVMTMLLGAAPSTAEQVAPFRRALSGVLGPRVGQRFPSRLPDHPTARAIAREAIATTRTLAQIAATHRMSTRQVQRVFVAETGFGFVRWRTRARLNEAVAHLAAGGSMTTAARVSGYGTRQGLLRAMSRELGVPVEAIVDDPRIVLAEQASASAA